MSIRILHVLDHSIPLHSGYAFRTQAILEQQKNMGFETFHLTGAKQGNPKTLQESIDGLTFYRTEPGFLSALPIINQWDVIRGLRRRLTELILQVHPDIIHAHSPALNGVAATQVAKQFNIPFVYEVRSFWEDAAVDHGVTKEGSIRYKLTRHMESFTLHRADAITCICNGLKNDIISRGIPKENLTLIPNAVNLEKFRVQSSKDIELEQALKLDGCMVLGFIGSFYTYEGLDLLVEALPAIVKRHNRVKLLLVGGGGEEAKVHHLIGDLALADRVILAGRVPHDQVGRYYSLVDIFVYPRRPMRLTELVTPLKPLEAMASGKLVVASNVGGHKELIRHQDNGYLFQADDPHALSNMINELLDNPQKWMSVVQRARRYVEQERNWQVAAEPYRHIYHRVIDKRAKF